MTDLSVCLDFNIREQEVVPCRGLLELLDQKKHTDVVFLVEGERVPAHRVILASQSPYFECLLYGPMREAKKDEIQLWDTPPSAFSQLLRYMYSGRINSMTLQTCLDLLCLADRYGFEKLRDSLDKKLCTIVDYLNAVQFFFYAQMANASQLQRLCGRIMNVNASKVLASEVLLALPEEQFCFLISRDTFIADEVEIFRAVQRWIGHNKKTKEEASRLLECVRLSEIPKRNILDVVNPSGLYDMSTLFSVVEAQKSCDIAALDTPRGIKGPAPNLLQMKATRIHSFSNYTLETCTGVQTGTVCDFVFVYSECDPAPASITIEFSDFYLMNEFKFEGYYQVPAVLGSEEEKPFSYKLEVSRDLEEWRAVVDFSKLRCYEFQVLHFPKQAVKYIRLVQMRGVRGFTVRFQSCSLVENIPFHYLKNGILAPLTPVTPGYIHYLCERANCQRCFLTFNQPYSISFISLRIEGLDGTGQVSISVATHNRAKNYRQVAMRYHHDFSLQLEASFVERPVSILSISIWEFVDRKGKRVWRGLQFTVTGLSCQSHQLCPRPENS